MPKLAHQVHEDSQKRKTSYGHLISSSLSGTIARSVTHPLERLRIMQQLSQPGYTNGNSILSQLIHMQRKEGVIGLFKGNSINCLGAAPFTALEFYLYEFFKNNLWPEVQYQDLTLRHKFICGGFAGMCAQSLLNPLDVIKTHYTIEQNPSKSARSLVIEKAKLIWNKEGPRGFMKGNMIAMASVAPFIALRQSIFDFQVNTMSNQIFTADDIKGRSTPYIAYEFCSGALSGLVAISVCYPLDMLRRMMQLNGMQSNHNYTGYRDLFTQVHQRDGWRGFYRGFTATCLKVIPATALLFICNNNIKKLIMNEEELVGGFVKLPKSPVEIQDNESS